LKNREGNGRGAEGDSHLQAGWGSCGREAEEGEETGEAAKRRGKGGQKWVLTDANVKCLAAKGLEPAWSNWEGS